MTASFLTVAETVLRAMILAGQAGVAVAEAVQAFEKAGAALDTNDAETLRQLLDRVHAETLRIGGQLDAILAAQEAGA